MDPLPSSWFREQQISDNYNDLAARTMPAMVLVDTEDASQTYGAFHSTSAFQLQFHTLTTFPTFALIVREHHRGDNNDKHSQDAYATTGLPIPLARLTKIRGDPNACAPNPVKDELQFDLDAASASQVKILGSLTEDLANMVTAAGQSLSPTASFGVFTYYSKADSLPARAYGQRDTFTPDSPQKLFFDQVSGKQCEFTIICELARISDFQVIHDQQYLDLQAWEVFRFLVNTVRIHPGNAKGRNDWFLSRFENYKEQDDWPYFNTFKTLL